MMILYGRRFFLLRVLGPWQLLWLCFFFGRPSTIIIRRCEAVIGPDGLIDLFVFVPFTISGESTRSLSGRTDNSSSLNPGYSHMIAALLAMDHFNNRRDFTGALIQNCSNSDGGTIKFNLNATKVFDTGYNTHAATYSLFDSGITPSAIAGPFADVPSFDLSAMALSGRYPIVLAGGSNNIRHTLPHHNPFTTQVGPDTLEGSRLFVDFLLHRLNRTDYIAVFYSATDGSVQRKEALTVFLDEYDITYTPIGYQREGIVFTRNERRVRAALQRVKETGFRTIVVILEWPRLEIPEIADAAEDLGMNNGDYVWVWFLNFHPSLAFETNGNVTKLLSGSTWTFPLDRFYFDANDPFARKFRGVSQEFMARVNAMNPIAPGQPGYERLDSLALLDAPEWGTSFMYDSVMSIGIGACLAERGASAFNGTILGEAHLAGIRRVELRGASGRVRFGGPDFRPGVRSWDTVAWGTFNILPPNPNSGTTEYLTLTEAKLAGDEHWTVIADHYFANGKQHAPELLRATPEQNYLPKHLRVLGFVFFGVVALLAAFTAVWVFAHRNHRVWKAAQPVFLYVIAFGAVVQASTIFTLSFDEAAGLTSQQLSALCVASPWLMGMGFVLIYGALFCKLWRVNRVLQFSRRKIEIRHVAWPMFTLGLATVLLLSLWTALAPTTWERREINTATGESIGTCRLHEANKAYTIPLLIILLIPAVLTAVMAWKTKDVDDAYSESWWIFILIVVQIEMVIVAVPVLVILVGISTVGRYVGTACLAWLFPMSTLLLIMVPKFEAHRRAVAGIANSQKRGDSSGTVRVTGLVAQKDWSRVASLGTNNRNNVSSLESAATTTNQQGEAQGAENQ